MLSAVIASALVGLALPAVAAAHHRHHHSRHARNHHATSARIVTFGAASASSGPTSTSPTTPPSGPEEAGKVAKFEGGVLTIALSGGTQTVSGKVTEDTELHCQPPTPPEASGDDQDEGDNGSGEQSGDGSDSGGFATGNGDLMAHSADSQDDEGGGQQTCTTEALTTGTVVIEAELKLTSTGAVWEKLDIVH
jgi:hypothetical protein